MRFTNALGLAGILLLLAGTATARAQDDSSSVPSTIYPLKAKGVTNLYQLSSNIFSGSTPEGNAGFGELKKLGIKTMITVDGARPDTNAAGRFGIRCVHLPFGYDGVPTNQALRLVKAAQTLPTPILVNSKHGVNRGPTAAAIICMATEGWNSDQAMAWMKVAGTSPEYAGLYKSVIRFKRPSAETMTNVSDYFISEAGPDAFRDKMVEIDQHFSNLELIKKANYTTPPDKPNLNPEQEAALLNDLFVELEKLPAVTNRSEDFLHDLHQAKTLTGSLHNLLIADPQSAAARATLLGVRDDVLQDIKDSCANCHEDFRNK